MQEAMGPGNGGPSRGNRIKGIPQYSVKRSSGRTEVEQPEEPSAQICQEDGGLREEWIQHKREKKGKHRMTKRRGERKRRNTQIGQKQYLCSPNEYI